MSTTALDARRMGPLLGPHFQKRRPTPDFKKAGKARRCCFTLASRVRGQPGEVHEDFGFSGSVTLYRSRSAFASSVRPSASSASAVTRALSLVQACKKSGGCADGLRARDGTGRARRCCLRHSAQGTICLLPLIESLKYGKRSAVRAMYFL
jgi:hypothetical protein